MPRFGNAKKGTMQRDKPPTTPSAPVLLRLSDDCHFGIAKERCNKSAEERGNGCNRQVEVFGPRICAQTDK